VWDDSATKQWLSGWCLKADLQGGPLVWKFGPQEICQGGAPCLASLILVFLKMILWVFVISENPK